METCCGAHEWARRLQDLGHDVKLMAPRHVKPYLQGNKTDARDALAIAEAAARDSVPSVAIRSVAGQQIQALHRARELWMKQRIALSNQIRGLLAEFGEVMPQGMRTLLVKAVHTVEAVKNGLKNAETGRENQALTLAVSAPLPQHSALTGITSPLAEPFLQRRKLPRRPASRPAGNSGDRWAR